MPTGADPTSSNGTSLDSLLTSLDDNQKEIFSEMYRALERSRRTNSIDELFPPDGPVRRELYQKHMGFFAAGPHNRERAFMAANRIGKTMSAGGYETACHLMGDYPAWWPGRKWERPVRAWAAGDTGETVKEIIQPVLFGAPGELGTGLIRAEAIERTVSRRGSPDALESVRVKHVSGGLSTLLFKSYEQGRKAFQGTKMDLIWCDEEPSMAIYSECLLRTAATTPDGDDWGSIMCTFTPLLGISEVVQHYLDDAQDQVPDPQPRAERPLRNLLGETPEEDRKDLMGLTELDPLPNPRPKIQYDDPIGR